MKKLFTAWIIIFVFVLVLLLSIKTNAQLSSPTTEAVYGGRINAITGIATSVSSSTIFIATESANSLFYADVTNTTSTPSFGTFTSIPDVNADDNYGSGLSKISAHSSGFLFFISGGNLYKVNTTASSITTISSSGTVSSLLVYGDYLLYIDGSNFVSKTLDSGGNITATVTFAISITGTTIIQVNPSNNKVYIGIVSTTSPAIYKTSDNYNALTGGSTFTSLSLGSMTTSVTWNGFGIGPDGTLFYGGDLSSTKYVNYSINDGVTWSGGSTALSGVSNTTFSFNGSVSPYVVYYTNGYATYTNGSGFGSWLEFGNSSFETHPNDGVVFTDPTNSLIVYMTTDQGLGKTTNGGSIITEFDDGIEAVQVNDFSMKSDKTTAWLASKAGVRKVTNWNTTPTWTVAMFPNGDGSPYYSSEMENDNDATAYVGNVRVYKTTDSGSNWSQVLSETTTGYPSVGSRAEAIEVCPTNSNLVLAGFYIDGTDQGGLWYSTNGGSSWTQLQLRSGSTLPNDVDVYDIAFTTESGNPVAYIGVYYDLSISSPSDRGYSIYRAEWNGSSWSTRQDMQGTYTSTGSVIVVTIIDIEVNSAGTIIYVCGTDASTNHPVAYYKNLSGTNLWTPMPVTGFPTGNEEGKAIASGGGFIYCAVNNVIYTIPTSGTEWSVGYTYPAGTQINVLFYDDLLVGTGTGFYGQSGTPLPVELTSFIGSVTNNSVSLSWQTATEVNNYGFEIERMRNYESGFINWEKIGFVSGYGNSHSPKNYSFIDTNPPSGKLKYRLKQIDTDGSVEYSQVVEVETEIPKQFSLYQNYPNPFNPVTTISFTIPQSGNVKLVLYNALGQEIATLIHQEMNAGIYNYQLMIDNYKLSSGVYFYKLQSGSFTQTKKLLLMK